MNTINAMTVWLVTGTFLLVLELLSGTFVLMFLALGCLAAGLFTLVPEIAVNYGYQAIICGLVTVIGVFLLRRPIQQRLIKNISLNNDIGKEILADAPIGPHQTSRITYQGTGWQAMNLDAQPIAQKDRVIIVGIDGNTLLLRKIN